MSCAERISEALKQVDEFRDDSRGLLRALLPHKESFAPLSESLRRGTLLWSLSCLLDDLRRDPKALAQRLPVPDFDPKLAAALRDESLMTAAVVFRTWVSLVYMRFDRLVGILKTLPRDATHLNAYLDLLLSEDLRHMRNAISHGSFEAEFGQLTWQDRQVSGLIDYELLQRLNLAVFTFWLNLDAIAVAPPGARV